MPKPRHIEVQTAQGKSLAHACKKADLRAGLRDACLGRENFSSLKAAQIVIGLWQKTSNHVWLNPSLDDLAPTPVSSPDPAFRLRAPATMQSPSNRLGPKNRSGHPVTESRCYEMLNKLSLCPKAGLR